QVQFLGENVCSSSWKKSKRNAVTVLVGGQAVDDFVERAVAAAGNDEAAAFGGGALGDFRSMARAGGFRKFRFDAAGGENVARGIERAAAAFDTVAGVGVVCQSVGVGLC